MSVAFVTTAGISQEQDPLSEATEVQGAEDLNRFLSEFDSLSARFTQELWSADGVQEESSSGSFLLLRPNRFLWHYETPFEQIIVADGETLWMYDVELAQVTRTELSEVPPGNPALLLSGDVDVEQSFSVTESFTHDGRNWTRLVPRATDGDFAEVLLAFDSDGPSALELVDGLDQTTRVEFSLVELNASIDPKQFSFTPPAGTDVIGQAP